MSKRIVISMSMTIELQDDKAAGLDPHVAHCQRCGWTRGYENSKQAARGLRAHHGTCKTQPVVIDPKNAPIAPIMQFWNEMLKQE
jgi:hypothetical protein